MAPRRQIRRLRAEGGFALAELLIAMFVTGVGLVATVGALDVSRKLTTLSERKGAATAVAQREIERIQALGYESVALAATPGTSGDPLDPRTRVNPGGTFTWKQGEAPEELTIDASAPLVSGPEPFDDGRTKGQLWRFVTWVDDPNCGLLCPGTHDFKRISVAVTLDSPGGPQKPIFVQSTISDPDDGVLENAADGLLNPLEEPDTKCLEGGQWVQCAGSVAGSALSFFPYDTSATVSNVRQLITGSHTTHPTIAPVSALLCNLLIVVTGCPKPDLMGATPPPGPAAATDPLPPLLDYSSELIGGRIGGRVLRQDVGCGSTPTQDNTKSQMWTTPPLTEATELNGEGGLTLFSQTIDGVAADAKVCVRFYDVPNALLNLIAFPPTTLGTASYELASWPQTAAPVSFSFDFRSSDVTVPAGHRIGMRIWADPSSDADIAAIYDHPSYPTSVQLTAVE